MSFAGHVLDMIQKARNNSALLASKKERYKSVKAAHANAKAKTSLIDNDIKLSKDEWRIYKKELKLKLEQQSSKEIHVLIFMVVLIVVSGFFIWLLFL
jgi:hypothetical protein